MEYKAYAKINLTLDIVGRDTQGYHMLDSLMTTVSLHDSVTVNFRTDTKVATAFVPPNLPIDPINNTAHSAAVMMAQHIGSGAEISILKRIPIMAGLGGSSVNAAAVINAYLNEKHSKLSLNMLSEIKKLGSDIPFLLHGGAAIVRSRGEDIISLPPMPILNLVIAMDTQVSTAKCFGEYRRLNPDLSHTQSDYDNSKAAHLALAWSSGNLSLISKLLSNDLEEAAISLSPELALTKQAILRHTSPLSLTLTGSGGAYIALFPDRQTAEQAAEALRPYVKWVTSVTTIPSYADH